MVEKRVSIETWEISRLPDLILKRKQNNFNTHCNNNTSFEDRIKETQDKKGIIDKKKRKLHYFVVKLTNEDRATDRGDLMLR